MRPMNHIARFATVVKDIHAERMAEILPSARIRGDLADAKCKVAFASHAGKATVTPGHDGMSVRLMVLEHGQCPEYLDLTRTFLANDHPRLASETTQFRRPTFKTPSARAAAHLGIDGISCAYEKVLGDEHAAIWERLYRNLSDRALRQEIYNALVEEYPELPRVKDYPAVWTVVLNCVQKLVPSDIEHWLFGSRGQWYQDYLEHVMRLSGGRELGWVPSIATLRRIEDVVGPRFRTRHGIVL